MVYNNLSVESSVLKAFEIENQTKILVVIKINETFNKNYDLIKSKILSNLTKEEFEFKGTISGSDWITGYLNLEGLEKLKNNPYVSIVHEEGKLSIQLQQSLPLINATDAWTKGYTGKNQTICVIDSGINASHLDLSGKIVATASGPKRPYSSNSGYIPYVPIY